MGLFHNKNELCPICGGPVLSLFPTKIDGKSICGDCDRNIDLPVGALERMSLQEFRKYIICHDENEILRKHFSETWHFDSGMEQEILRFDFDNGLFRFREKKESFVFRKSELLSFRFLDDQVVLLEGDSRGLHCYQTNMDHSLKEMSANGKKVKLRFELSHPYWESMEQEISLFAPFEEKKLVTRSGHRPKASMKELCDFAEKIALFCH